MKPMDRSKASHLPSINIKAQLAATHNTTFPFSSPHIDENSSFRSGRTGNTALSRNPHESPGSSSIALTDYESGGTSDCDEWHLERYSQQTADRKSQILQPKIAQSKRRPRPGLQIVTDFSKPVYRTNELLVAEVQAKHAQARLDKARSVVSQKGVRVDPGTPRGENSAKLLTTLKELINNKMQKRQGNYGSGSTAGDVLRMNGDSQNRGTVVTGLRVLDGDTMVLQQTNNLDNRGILNTPCTPAIILTPPIERLAPFTTSSLKKPVSSIYSTASEGKEPPGYHGTPPSMSNTPVLSHGGQTLMSRNPFRKQYEPFPAHLEDDKMSSANTPRSTSDGWWNLMLSPMLSRAGSIMSKRGHEADESPPPVPAIPTELEKQLSAMTPRSRVSPDTPRRLGLASPHESSWSQWTEVNRDMQTDEDTHDGTHHTGQIYSTKEKEFPLILAGTNKREGLAAEYFHACAVEQLTDIAYFECVNHSCSEKRPKLQSIYDSPRESKKVTEGSCVKRDAMSPKGLAILPLLVGEKDIEDDRVKSLSKEKIAVIDPDNIPSQKSTAKSSSPLAAALTATEKEPVSNSFDSDSEPDELSPTVRKANTAAVVRARALDASETSTAKPARKVGRAQESLPNIAAVIPDAHPVKSLQITPADPEKSPLLHTDTFTSSAATTTDSNERGSGHGLGPASVSDHSSLNQSQFPPPPHQLPPNQLFFNSNTSYPDISSFARSKATYPHDVQMSQRSQSSDRSEHVELKEEEKQEKNRKIWNRCFSRRRKSSPGDHKDKKKRKKRRWLCCLVLLLLAIIAVCVALAMTLTRRGDGTPVNSRWLNLTGYPPMPTGISTVAQPNLARSESGCTSPQTLWSCALPKEDQVTIEPNKPDQPNFRFEIKFRNGTTPADMTIALHKRATDPFTNELFTASPSPPNQMDQLFLGSTTDNITAPFDGEITPFYITLMSTYPAVPSSFNLTKRLYTRQSDFTSGIPAPAVEDDGTAAPAVSLPTDPYPVSQPIKLYNRGKNDEHYGFYMYYDKSIFLSGITIQKGNATRSATPPADDQNGGTNKVTASVRCTWQQTRFIVKMYTNPLFDAVLLEGTASSANLTEAGNDQYSSAIDFSRPGSFPYPMTIAIDRHGGNVNRKITYCYGMTGEKINVDQSQPFREFRSFGGQLVNPAPGLINDGNYKFNSSAGGIDGGTGGCGCWWQNWK